MSLFSLLHTANILNPDDYARSVSKAPELSYKYQQLLDSNPYRNVDYKVSPWQKLLSMLGFRTQADAWRENMTVQANEYDQAIVQKAYDEDYNDAFSQAARMRAAGINPDLDPSSIDSGEAAPLGEDPSTPMQSTGEEGVLMSFAEGVMNIASTAIGLVGSVQGITRNRLENSLLSMQNESAISDLATRMAPYFIPPTDESLSDDYNWKSHAFESAKIFAGSMDKRSRDRFLSTIQSYWNGALGEAKSYEEFKHNLESRFSTAVSHRTLEDEYGALNLILAEELGSLNEQILKLSAESEKKTIESNTAEAQFNQEYYGALDGQIIGEAEKAQAAFNKQNFEINKLLNDSIDRMIDRLEATRKEGGISGGLASVAMSLLAGLRLMITTAGLPSVSRSSSSSLGGSNWSNGAGTASHQSASGSFSVGW